MKFKLNKVLNNRIYLMGIAMLLVVVFHSNLPIINHNFFKYYAYIGVDIFLFLSGIGIAQSLNKNSSKSYFYKKRFKKILTIAFPIIVIGSLFLYFFDNDFGVKEFYLQTTFFNFFTNHGNFALLLWYIPAILIYYLISPFVFDFYKNSKSKAVIILIIICVMLCSFAIPSGPLSNISYLCNRLPIYILGLIFGIRTINKSDMGIWEFLFWVLLTIVGMGVLLAIFFRIEMFSNLYMIASVVSFIPIVVIFSILCSYVIDYLKDKKLKFRILKFIGNYTLAIYSSHEIFEHLIRGVIYKYGRGMFLVSNAYIYALTIFVITIIFAVSWTKFIEWLLKEK